VIDERFVFVGVAVSAVAQIAYVRATLRGETQPNRVSFLLWALAPMLAFAVEIDEGVGLRSLSTFMFGFGPLLILVASFRRGAGAWTLGRLDYTCGAISLAGTAAWLIAQQGTVAILAAVAADALAGVPTFVKSWRAPETERWPLYAGATFNGVIALLTVDEFTTADVAFPLYIVLFGTVLTWIVAGRRVSEPVRSR
jgi:hypothetical protein